MQWKARHVIMTSAFASALFMLPTEGKAAQLKIGMSDAKVKEVQQLLKAAGFFTYPTATGYYGTITETAVKNFQSSVKLPVTGVVDDQTYAKLKTASSPQPALKQGASGEAVKTLQQQLKTLGLFTYSEITGYYGTITADAVKKFQKQAGLPATGAADNATLTKLKDAANAKTKTSTSSVNKATIYLTIGSSGDLVKEVQTKLKQLGHFTYPEITSYYGTITADAVKKFQKQAGLSATGTVDNTTLTKLREAAQPKETAPSGGNQATVYLTIGSSGDLVKEVQTKLKQLGHFTYPEITSYYGTITADAVKKFQKQAGLSATGTVDNATLTKLREAAQPKETAPSGGNQATIYITIGSSGDLVKEVQTKLNQLGLVTSAQITGYYGMITADAVRQFQQTAGLKVTGIVDDTTYQRLKAQNSVQKVDPIELVADAALLLGKPYVWGGQTPEQGFDCSGLIYYLFQQQGVKVPRTVATMWNAGTSVSSPSIGDMVFFKTEGNTVSHVGIYIGNNQFLHSGSSTGVTISSFSNSYWSSCYVGAKRYW
ncbi:peptidoglycan-binding protein [Anoxybacillus rupiensis]|uniref:Peptidoglycan-binding protein n=1 Tax=Anoxybacteroides rupiense TaxID=311460 RepID=A0ABD5IZK3_9BACL|nr:peptidoglycan-binding protein [Anoxybacillus rupiensis]